MAGYTCAGFLGCGGLSPLTVGLVVTVVSLTLLYWWFHAPRVSVEEGENEHPFIEE